MKNAALAVLALTLAVPASAVRLGSLAQTAHLPAAWVGPVGVALVQVQPGTNPGLSSLASIQNATQRQSALAPLFNRLEANGWTPDSFAAADPDERSIAMGRASDEARSALELNLLDTSKETMILIKELEERPVTPSEEERLNVMTDDLVAARDVYAAYLDRSMYRVVAIAATQAVRQFAEGRVRRVLGGASRVADALGTTATSFDGAPVSWAALEPVRCSGLLPASRKLSMGEAEKPGGVEDIERLLLEHKDDRYFQLNLILKLQNNERAARNAGRAIAAMNYWQAIGQTGLASSFEAVRREASDAVGRIRAERAADAGPATAPSKLSPRGADKPGWIESFESMLEARKKVSSAMPRGAGLKWLVTAAAAGGAATSVFSAYIATQMGPFLGPYAMLVALFITLATSALGWISLRLWMRKAGA